MTCIVGVIEKKTIVMGADSQATSGNDIIILKNQKLFRLNGLLLGLSGSPREQQILQYACQLPKKETGKDIFTYLVTDFTRAVRGALKEHGFLQKKDEQEKGESWLLIGAEGRLFYIAQDFQIGEREDPYNAIGSGAPYALGTLHGLSKSMPAKEKILIALAAAEHFSTDVCRPFHVEVTA